MVMVGFEKYSFDEKAPERVLRGLTGCYEIERDNESIIEMYFSSEIKIFQF